MDEAQFVATDAKSWWLVDPEVAYEINNSRLRLGEAFGWRDPEWYTYEKNLRDVYQELQSHHSDLIYQLDKTIESPSEQLQWLEAVVTALEGKRTEAAEAAQPAEAPAEVAEIWSDERGMLYRLVDNVYEFAYSDDQRTVRPGTEWMTEQELQSRSAAQPGTWNEDWGMLLRVGPSGAYQFAHSDDQRTVRPGTEWMSQEEAMQSRAARPVGEATETEGVEIPSAVQEVMSQMASDPAGMAARLGISEEQAAELAANPEFQARVAAAFQGASS